MNMYESNVEKNKKMKKMKKYEKNICLSHDVSAMYCLVTIREVSQNQINIANKSQINLRYISNK